MDKLLRDDVGFIERESFYSVKGGGVSDDCNVESESDGSWQQARIHQGRA